MSLSMYDASVPVFARTLRILSKLLEKGEAYTTAEFKVNFMRPVTAGTGEVICEGRVIHRGRSLAVSEATLKDKNGKLLAFATETCSIFPVSGLSKRSL